MPIQFLQSIITSLILTIIGVLLSLFGLLEPEVQAIVDMSSSTSAAAKAQTYNPRTPLDVHKTHFLLTHRLKLPTEISLMILEHADYHLRIFATRSDEQKYHPHRLARDMEPYLSFRIPGGQGRVRKLRLVTRGHDQGWSSFPADRGSYANSWTWFDVVVTRPAGPAEGWGEVETTNIDTSLREDGGREQMRRLPLERLRDRFPGRRIGGLGVPRATGREREVEVARPLMADHTDVTETDAGDGGEDGGREHIATLERVVVNRHAIKTATEHVVTLTSDPSSVSTSVPEPGTGEEGEEAVEGEGEGKEVEFTVLPPDKEGDELLGPSCGIERREILRRPAQQREDRDLLASMKPGDEIAVYPKAAFAGWVHIVQGVGVEVFLSVL